MKIPNNIIDIFSPFWTLHSWGYYWRPLVKLIYNLLLLVNGFHPFLFHLVALLLYSVVPGLVALSANKIGFDRRTAILSGLIFAILPSHELHAAWLSDMVENLSAIFILLTSIAIIKLLKERVENLKDYFFVVIIFLLALLSKEIAFALLILPLLILLTIRPIENSTTKKAFIITFTMILTFSIYMVYRIVIIGSNPFGAHHFHDSNFLSMIKNFLLYIPVSFVSPDWLEFLFLKFSFFQLIIGGIFLTIAVILLLIKIYPNIQNRDKPILLFSFGWYLIFIIPVLPTFMRWYAFVASIGLIWIISFFIIKMADRFFSKKYFYSIGTIILILLFYSNITTSLNWIEAGQKMERAILNIHQNKDYISSDTIVVWGMPDKFKRVSLMKLGAQQAFDYALIDKRIELISPIKSEIILSNSQIGLIVTSDSSFTLELEGGRFLQEGGKSRKVIIEEELNYSDDEFDLKVMNKVDESVYPYSKCEVVISKKMQNYFHLYFDGEDFRRIKLE
jgi:hypothetical protein